MNELSAGHEGALTRFDGAGKGNRDYVLYCDEGRPPAAVGQSTVQPVNAAIGAAGLGRLLCEAIR